MDPAGTDKVETIGDICESSNVSTEAPVAEGNLPKEVGDRLFLLEV